MNRSAIFRNAHKMVKTSIEMSWPKFKGMTYAQRLSVCLKEEYKKAAPAKTYTIKLEYSQMRLRKLVKANGGTWNSATKTWKLVTNDLPYDLEPYVVTGNEKPATKSRRKGMDWVDRYARDPFMNWE